MIEPSFGLVLSDAAGRLRQVDRLICRMLGYEARDLLGMTVEGVTHPEDWEMCRLLLERLHADDEPFSVAKRYVRCDGSAVWAQVHVTLVRDAGGRSTVSAMIRPVLRSLALPVAEAPRAGLTDEARQEAEAGLRLGRRVMAEGAMSLAGPVPGARLN